jgi:hypothetical protein
LKHHAELVIVKPASSDQALAAQRLSVKDLPTTEQLKQIGELLGVEGVILGRLTDTVDGYLLTVTVRLVTDGSELLTSEQPFAHSRVLDSVAATDAELTASTLMAGVNGIGAPSCNYQPAPVFPFEAKKANVTFAIAILAVVITPEGRLMNIRVIKDPGYGFTERAVEALTEWRCKPARDKDKKPVAVAVPIEITFRD